MSALNVDGRVLKAEDHGGSELIGGVKPL